MWHLQASAVPLPTTLARSQLERCHLDKPRRKWPDWDWSRIRIPHMATTEISIQILTSCLLPSNKNKGQRKTSDIELTCGLHLQHHEELNNDAQGQVKGIFTSFFSSITFIIKVATTYSRYIQVIWVKSGCELKTGICRPFVFKHGLFMNRIDKIVSEYVKMAGCQQSDIRLVIPYIHKRVIKQTSQHLCSC